MRAEVLPFPIGEKRSSDLADTYDDLIGTTYYTIFNSEEVRVRLCRLNIAAGLSTDVGGRIVKESTAGAHDVELADAATDYVYGIIPDNQEDLVDNDYFFVIVEGICEVRMGDDATAFVAGDLIGISGDTDEGKAEKDDTYEPLSNIGTAVDADPGDNELFTVKIMGTLGA
jgi:hypothetical protein